MAKFRRRARGRELKKSPVNEQIRHSKLKVVLPDGGVQEMTKAEALSLAKSHNLDLILISETDSLPICKIIDYGKHLYEQKKKENQKFKSQQKTEVKGIRVSMNIGDHDLEIKLKHAKEFLEDKNKVKFTMQFRGREMAHMDMGVEKMNEVAEKLSEVAQLDQAPQKQGRQIHMLLSPGKRKK